MDFSTLPAWLDYITAIHPQEMDLGLDRVRAVGERLQILHPECPVIIVGGTNGKGSTVAGLSAIYRAAGYNVGAFTSPILFRHNEQVRINGKEQADAEFCAAFRAVENARGDITLTPFEFQTLAALVIFAQHDLDILILEVGLGGRLDAVNILDADVAIITSISLDHTDLLGDTREKIAYEKAGIMRSHHPVICGDINPPGNLPKIAKELSAPFFCAGQDFIYQENTPTWLFIYKNINYVDLPYNNLLIQNMACVLMAITLLQNKLPVNTEEIKQGLQEVSIRGRMQIIPGQVMHIYDVAHNPDSVKQLAKKLRSLNIQGKCYAIFSMLMDKDMVTSLQEISAEIHEWFVAPLNVKRGASKKLLEENFHAAQIKNTNFFDDLNRAYAEAYEKSKPGDYLIIFGSFHTVSALWDKAADTLKACAVASTSCTRK